MNLVDRIVEKKIAEASARGELSDLPGQGAPLELDDDSLVPEELRMAYRILRNAGFVPPEVAALREISDLERQIEELPQNGARARALRKLQLLRARLEAGGRFGSLLGFSSPYAQRLLDRFESEVAEARLGVAASKREPVG
jgi:hypothetical protein